MFLKRSVKFLHTLSAIGLMGGLAAYMLTLWAWPEPSSLEAQAALRAALALVSKWLILPSMLGVLVTGLLAMAVHAPYMSMPWVWAKMISGVLVFEASLGAIDGPAQKAARVTAQAVAGEVDAAELAALVHNEWIAWWTLLALAAANVALAVWRPRFGVKP